jgi:hypothetical protein
MPKVKKKNIVAKVPQKESEIEKLTRKLEEAKNAEKDKEEKQAEKNRQAVYDARGQLTETLDKHGMAMKGWGKAYSYTVISALLVGRKNIKELECFTKKVE